MTKAPKCLHIPKLYEEKTVDIIFDDVGANDYELGYVVDESFEEALKGLSWIEIQKKDLSWDDMELKLLTWQGISEISGDDSITTVLGKGLIVPGTDTGLTWKEADGFKKSWDQILKTWDEIEGLSTLGLSWDSIESRYIPWEDITSSWNSIEQLSGDTDPHRSIGIEVPKGRRNMQFRISADGSEYLISNREYIVSTDDAKCFSIKEENTLTHIDSELIRDLKDREFQISKREIQKIKDSDIPKGTLLDSDIWTIPFTAQKQGTSKVNLEHVNRKT